MFSPFFTLFSTLFTANHSNYWELTFTSILFQEGKALLGDSKIDADASTRGQQKKMDEIAEEAASPSKKPRMSKAGTMAATAKVFW